MGGDSDTAAKWLFISAVAWLGAAVTVALILAVKFVFPEFLSGHAPLQFGRLRPVHITLAAFGWLSMVQVGMAYYTVPRLARVELHSQRLAKLSVLLWNLFLILAALTLLAGMTQGREYAELIYPLDLLFLALLALVAYNLLRTVLVRKEEKLYVTLWYFLAALVWMPVVYFVGNVMWTPRGALYGVNDAIVNWFYGHNILGLWFTPLGVGAAYYLLPKLVQKPLYSHRLSLLGFWTLGLFYPWVGTHHLIFGPVPVWAQSVAIIASVAMVLPVLAVTVNFWKTVEGRWHLLAGARGRLSAGDSVALKFLVLGGVWYLLTCLQGPFQALRQVQPYVHFTNWVVAHAHLALLGAFSFWGFACIYYALPRLTGAEVSPRLARVHFYLLTLGLSGFIASLTVAGLIQGSSWQAGAPFVEVVASLRPYLVVRLVSAVLMVASVYIFIYAIFSSLRGVRG